MLCQSQGLRPVSSNAVSGGAFQGVTPSFHSSEYQLERLCLSVTFTSLQDFSHAEFICDNVSLHDETQRDNIERISSDRLWSECKQSVEKSLKCFSDAGIELPVQEYLFTILLANAESPYISMNEGYCGDGGIPGYIFSWLIPNDYTLEHLPVALAHETNHNVRFQFIKWRNDITLGEMMVSEGLAENFATYLYGEDKAGPWVKKTDMKTLNEYIKPIIYDGLDVQGLENLNAYLYGDEMAALQNYPPVGLPYCAGYACGYHLVKYYLQKTGKSIVEATLLSANEILSAVEDFWNE